MKIWVLQREKITMCVVFEADDIDLVTAATRPRSFLRSFRLFPPTAPIELSRNSSRAN